MTTGQIMTHNAFRGKAGSGLSFGRDGWAWGGGGKKKSKNWRHKNGREQQSAAVSGDEMGHGEGLMGKKRARTEDEREPSRGAKERRSYHVDETLLDAVQGGPQSAADEAQTR